VRPRGGTLGARPTPGSVAAGAPLQEDAMLRRNTRWLAAIVLAFPVLARAADPPPSSEEPEVLLPRGARHGGWGGPAVTVTTVRDRGAVFLGARGGWLIDGRFTLGGAGFGMVNRIPAPDAAEPAGRELELEMGYGGAWLEYTFAPLRLLHVSFGVLVGGGGLTLVVPDGGSYDGDGDAFFALEPAVTAELNLATFMRLDLGASYRWISGIDTPGLSGTDLSAPAAIAVLKFGKF
jgi:hypothetical protein